MTVAEIMKQPIMIDPVPSKMHVHEGRLEIGNTGESARAYVAQWQADNGYEDGTPVCLVTRKTLSMLIELAHLNVCA